MAFRVSKSTLRRYITRVMRLLLVRHGETRANSEQRIQGRLDEPLTERGRSQVRALGQAMRRLGLRWDSILSSPLARAWQTAELLEQGGSQRAVTECPELIEIGAGRLEGLTAEQIGREAPGFLGRPVEQLGDFSEYGGESADEVKDRVLRLYDGLVAKYLDLEQTLLLVSHGGLLFQLIRRMVCSPVPDVCLVRFGNCSLTCVDVQRRRGRVLGEIRYHVPIELFGEPSEEGQVGIFR